MQIFLPYRSPLETAKCLDKKRLNKQIIECHQIMSAIKGENGAWMNHPIRKMYQNDLSFVEYYTYVLEIYKKMSEMGEEDAALQVQLEKANNKAMELIPSFINDHYCDVMKRRLYTKDNEFYKQFENLGECEYNLYFVDGEWLKYVDGKKIVEDNQPKLDL